MCTTCGCGDTELVPAGILLSPFLQKLGDGFD